jgi:nicotinamidase-related amidase
MLHNPLSIPPHYDSEIVGKVWRVPYQQRAEEARRWAEQHAVKPASRDRFTICLLLVDVQNTFCIPEFELFVGGRSGTGAVDDNRRLCEFIYRNLNAITQISPTMDTHQAMQIFHPIFLVDREGNHPKPLSLITTDDVRRGVWKINPEVVQNLKTAHSLDPEFLRHYTETLDRGGKYSLTVWPYHAMLGGIGHALVSAVEQAVFFHTIARYAEPDFQIKGDNPVTENYSVVKPEVMDNSNGIPVAEKNVALVEKLMSYDALFVAGQAKSHCVAWTLDDLLGEIREVDHRLAEKVYILEDCMSPVVVPDVIDYTEPADAAFRKFSAAGMHLVRSTEPLDALPGMPSARA